MDLQALTGLMAESLLAHIPGASRESHNVLGLPVGGLRLKVLVQQVLHGGCVTQQHVWLHGGVLGERWIEDNFAGMGANPQDCVVRGAHDWVASTYQAVAAAFGATSATHQMTIDGTNYDVYTSPRTLRGQGVALSNAIAEPLVLRYADALGVLYTGPTFISTFVARSGGGETIEVKVDGSDWPTRDAVGALPWPDADYSSVREFSVLIPCDTPNWSAAAIRRTLERLPKSESGPGTFGASTHRWRVDPPLDSAPPGVPDDYAWFVTNVSASGAGPGYGLMSPVHEAQASLREGTFDGTAPRGVIALAHHGCGALTLLVCGGPHHGEVWVDARSNEAGFSRIASSFREYYFGWILRSARREPEPRVLDPSGCAMPRALSSFLNALDPGADAKAAVSGLSNGAVATTATGDEYFDQGDNLDLCTGCWHVGYGLGLQPRHVVAGVQPKQGRGAESGWTQNKPKSWS